jgi:hypothetical protein
VPRAVGRCFEGKPTFVFSCQRALAKSAWALTFLQSQNGILFYPCLTVTDRAATKLDALRLYFLASILSYLQFPRSLAPGLKALVFLVNSHPPD